MFTVYRILHGQRCHALAGTDAMLRTSDRRTRDEKLRLFADVFTGRVDAYGTHDRATGRSWCVKHRVTRRTMLDHLTGKQPYGIYLLTGTKTNAVVADFDTDDMNPVVDCHHAFVNYDVQSYVERSKSKGYHLWVFLARTGVSAAKARALMFHALAEIDHPATEVFPKQDQIETNRQLGNFINAPLFGGYVPHGRTVFLNPQDGWRPHTDQWQVLESIRRVSEAQLHDLIEINDVDVGRPSAVVEKPGEEFVAAIHGLPPCALAMLGGVTENQRVTCFRLAVHLYRLGIPEDLARPLLRAWARKNRPAGGKRVITDHEIIQQIGVAYTGRYRGYGCEDPIIARYCDEQCPVLRRP